MCCDELVCARCGGRVAEARCPVCRAARAALHHRNGDWSAYAVPVLVGLVALLYLILVIYLHTAR
jgi:hypothetical protein